MIHNLKTWPKYFRALQNGTKTFEVRREDDRTFGVSDTLVLREWAGETVWGIFAGEKGHGFLIGEAGDVTGYTGRQCRVEVTYVLRDFGGLEPGYVVMGIRLIQSNEKKGSN